MEEHTCLETHLGKMYDIYLSLTNVYDYLMADAFAITIVLRSLPPSYEEHVRGYVVKSESLTLYQFISRFRNVKVDPIEAEIIDPYGIFDIQIYKCIVFQYTC